MTPLFVPMCNKERVLTGSPLYNGKYLRIFVFQISDQYLIVIKDFEMPLSTLKTFWGTREGIAKD